jgi:hypothetical protein
MIFFSNVNKTAMSPRRLTQKKHRSFSLVFILIALLSSVLFVQCGFHNILSHGPPKPKLEVPVTYTLGWWGNQDKLVVDSFSVQIIESKLSLFNTQSLIAYTIRGHLNYQGEWKPYIKEVQISESFLPREHSDVIAAEIHLTPVVSVQVDKSKQGGIEYFNFTNQHLVHSFHWGENKVKFVCGKFERSIELFQKK